MQATNFNNDTVSLPYCQSAESDLSVKTAIKMLRVESKVNCIILHYMGKNSIVTDIEYTMRESSASALCGVPQSRVILHFVLFFVNEF